MSRRLVVAPVLTIASVTAAMAISSVAQAASVQTVFSAENALYGAGYSIGQADGWIDDELRSAIRQFQADRPGLSATGELDSPTLEALGVAEGRSQSTRGNSVASREAARKELGLTVAAAAKPAPGPEPAPQVAKPEPVAEPEPEPEPKPVARAEPVEQVKEAQAAPESRPEPEPEKMAKPAPQKTPEPAPEAEAQVAKAEPEPTSEPIRIVPKIRGNDNEESAEAPATDQVPDDTVSVASVGHSGDAETGPVKEQQAVEKNTDQAPVSTATESDAHTTDRQGNMLTRMFDFLFGWMV